MKSLECSIYKTIIMKYYQHVCMKKWKKKGLIYLHFDLNITYTAIKSNPTCHAQQSL